MKKLLTFISLSLISHTILFAQSWSLTGNSGTNANTNFLGTTDNKPLVIRTNNVEKMRITAAGKIGLGTANPATTFDCFGTFKAGGIINFCKIDTVGNIFPANTSTSDLGTTGAGWRNLYITGKLLLDKVSFIDNTGTKNTVIGNTANTISSGSSNTVTGDSAFFSNSGGSHNSFFGANAGLHNTVGSRNSFCGRSAGNANTKGNDNSFYGFSAGTNNTLGNGNVAIGDSAFIMSTTGNNNTALGFHADVLSITPVSNATAIGAGAKVDNSNKIALGNTSIASIQGQVPFTTFSDVRVKNTVQENVPGLAFITALRPVTYHYDVDKENELLGIKDENSNWSGKYDIERIQFSGFIAQEVDAAANKIGYNFSGVDKSGNMWGLRYSDFVVPLVKAVQELNSNQTSKDALIAQQQIQIDNQQKQIDELKQQMQQLDLSLSQCCMSYKSSSMSSQSSISDIPVLDQNKPNPFVDATVIKFYLPQSASTAVIKIYSVDGVVLKSFNINQKGYGEVTIAGNTLAPGVYAYTLIIDDKSIDTKQMVLTR